MSTKDKMIARLLSKPSDYTFIELQGLSSKLGCQISQHGSGSRCILISPAGARYAFHKPHSYSYFKGYVIKDLILFFQREGLI